MDNKTGATVISPVSTGIVGLDRILRGGLVPNRLYLVEGDPGTGKTTLALQFLLEGVKQGEKVLYITLSETKEELRVVANSHGWDLNGVELFELANAESLMDPSQEMTLLHPWDVNPTRVAFDSLSELRLLAQDPLRYRRQILALKQFFAGRKTTVLMLDDRTGSDGGPDQQLHSISHGVISLQRYTLEFGAARRRLEVLKLRGLDFLAGWHDFVIRKGGIAIFPRLVASEHHSLFIGESVSSDLEEMDNMLNGGPLRGTSTLVIGPAGTGKTTVCMQYVLAAAKRGEKVVLYEFDERLGTLLTRAKKLNMDLEPFIEQGLISIKQIDPAEVSPGEFAHRVRDEVEFNHVQMVVIDSLNGYILGMPEEKQILLQMHELLSYLNHQGVVTFIVNPQDGIMGSMQSHINISYIADTVLLLRFFEANGRVLKAITVIKHRGGDHENAIREVRMDSGVGLKVGKPLTDFQGIFTGTPTYTGAVGQLLNEGE